MKKLLPHLLLALLVVGCDLLKEGDVHPLVGVWERIEHRTKKQLKEATIELQKNQRFYDNNGNYIE